MPPSLRPSDTDRPEPKLAAPGPRQIAEPLPLRRAAAAAAGREAPTPSVRAPSERPSSGFTAGERLTVASAMTGGEEEPRRRRPGIFRLILLAILIIFAGIGAASVYHSVAGTFPFSR
jgi:hypothetical protein